MKIEYVHKLGDEKKTFSVFEDAEIPENIVHIIIENTAFSSPQIFGQKGLGSPEEIEILNITYDDGTKREFEYHNQGIYYMLKGGEKERPVYQVFAYFMSKARVPSSRTLNRHLTEQPKRPDPSSLFLFICLPAYHSPSFTIYN